jgi:hypothetical protein
MGNARAAGRPLDAVASKPLVRLPMAFARSPCRSGDNLTRPTRKGGVEV